MDMAGLVDVFWHFPYMLSVNGAQVGILQQTSAIPAQHAPWNTGHVLHAPVLSCTPDMQKASFWWVAQCFSDTGISHWKPAFPADTSGASSAHPLETVCGGLPVSSWPHMVHLHLWSWWCQSCLWYHPGQLSGGWRPQQPPGHLQPPQLLYPPGQHFLGWWLPIGGDPWLGDPPVTCPWHYFHLHYLE